MKKKKKSKVKQQTKKHLNLQITNYFHHRHIKCWSTVKHFNLQTVNLHYRIFHIVYFTIIITIMTIN